MAKEQPITITYSGGNIKFHAIVEEDHEASSIVTSYPIQTGFNVSDHAIKKNRIVKLKGMFTNLILSGQKHVIYNKIDTTKEMFNVLNSLVQSRSVCTVRTNLGNYEPVIFNSFKNVQKEGLLDSMKFVMIGEEVQVASEVSKTTPIDIVFESVSEIEKERLISESKSSNLVVIEGTDKVSTAVNIGDNFTVGSLNDAGLEVDTTYVCKGYDSITGTWIYEIHKEKEELYKTSNNPEGKTFLGNSEDSKYGILVDTVVVSEENKAQQLGGVGNTKLTINRNEEDLVEATNRLLGIEPTGEEVALQESLDSARVMGKHSKEDQLTYPKEEATLSKSEDIKGPLYNLGNNTGLGL